MNLLLLATALSGPAYAAHHEDTFGASTSAVSIDEQCTVNVVIATADVTLISAQAYLDENDSSSAPKVYFYCWSRIGTGAWNRFGTELGSAITGSGGIGSTKWLLYGNSGSGFGPAATDWSLPPGYPDGALDSLADSSSSDGVVWGLLDLDGDGAVDLVVADTDAGSGGIGSTKYLLYANSGDGFGPSAAAWSLPAGFQDGALDPLSDSSNSDGVVWGLLDLSGDGAVDLIVAGTDAGSGGIGSQKWLVYENTGSGFSSVATDWSLPAGLQEGALDSLGDESSSDGVVWGLLDLDGDGAADLVVADSDAGGGIGETRWLSDGNTGTGFDSTAADWSLPVGFHADAFSALGDTSGGNGIEWGLMNLGQDNVVDIVIADNDASPMVGEAHWQISNAECQ